jgi:hypothetical protein
MVANAGGADCKFGLSAIRRKRSIQYYRVLSIIIFQISLSIFFDSLHSKFYEIVLIHLFIFFVILWYYPTCLLCPHFYLNVLCLL